MATDYRQKVLTEMQKYIGTAEPKGDDKFITAYNKWAGTSFGVDSTPWCAIYATYIARTVGVPTTIIPTFASCSAAVDWFKARSRWRQRGAYIPKGADLIFFDWDGDGKVDHIGYVKSVSGSTVYTNEGNTSDAALERSYSLSDDAIFGYAEPDYGASSVDTTASTTTTITPTVSASTKTTYIKKFQQWMNDECDQGLEVDGSFGPLSKKAAIKSWQIQMNAAYMFTNLTVDGSFGPACKLVATLHALRKGDKQIKLIYILQGMLYAHGYDPNGFDGSFGPGCSTALKSYQKNNSLSADGVVGPATWNALFNKW